jgi:hypothetical protein
MKLLAPTALAFTVLSACGVAPRDDGSTRDGNEPTSENEETRVVLNIGIDHLNVERFDLDLSRNIARFADPAAELPLDRVVIFGAAPDEAPAYLDDVVAACYEVFGYDVTGGNAFIVGQGEDLLTTLTASGAECAECGAAVICVGQCEQLGPGDVPPLDPSLYDVDPVDGEETGSNGGGEGGSEGGGTGTGTGTDSGSGAGSGGSGGSHGGVGNPGDGGW